MIAHSDKEGVTDHCRCRREKDTVRALSVRADEIFCKKNLLSLLVLNDAYREGGTVTPAGRNWRPFGANERGAKFILSGARQFVPLHFPLRKI